MNYQYIDIHTHSNKETESLNIINIFPENIDRINELKYYSIGLHPWNVQKVNIDEQIKHIEKYASEKNILAIGEIGLDKYKEGFDTQKYAFLKQLKIAVDYKKPVVVHCVKAYSELLEILKQQKLKIPVIIHRYSGNETIADQLLKYRCYLSFGHELFHSKSGTAKVFKGIPSDKVFLETDDSDISIKEIYRRACEIRAYEMINFKKMILKNFETCFGTFYT